jgi:hypothetical protein
MEKPHKDPQNEFLLEEEISPETLDIIISKVKPIDAFDTAFHGIESAGYHEQEKKEELSTRLKKIFKEGLLGFQRASHGQYSDEEKWSSERWKKETKQKLDNPIYFKIIRAGYDRKSFESSGGSAGNIQILFDVSSFSERINGNEQLFSKSRYEKDSKRDFPIHSYTTGGEMQGVYHKDDPKKEMRLYGSDVKDLDGLKKEGYYTGHAPEYLLYSRVAPRFFTGICLKKEEEQHLEVIVKSMVEAYKDSPELMVPIYNYKGDMLWPQKMTYEEIVERYKAVKDSAQDTSI